MGKRLTSLLTLISVLIVLLLLFQGQENTFLIIAFLMLFVSFLVFFMRFEQQAHRGRKIVLLAVLAGVAAVSRIPFAAFPGVQPTTFVVIMSGIVFGAESGFMVGTAAALVSNIFLGQGPWTPWQMAGWGMIGLIAGWMGKHPSLERLSLLAIFSVVSGFAFGWFMNLWFVLGFMDPFSWSGVLAYYAASFPMDLAHALSNVLFLFLFYKSWKRILTRFQLKYGILTKTKKASA